MNRCPRCGYEERSDDEFDRALREEAGITVRDGRLVAPVTVMREPIVDDGDETTRGEIG